MFQPLEQFVSWKVVLLTRSIVPFSFINMLVVDKYLVVVICTLVLLSCITWCMTNYNLSTAMSFPMKIYNWLQSEFVNVSGNVLSFFIPIFVTLFIYIYTFNVLGLMPYTSCWTTQFFGNVTISFILILGITLINIDKNGLKYFELFIPSGVPNILKPMLFVLEFLSYWIRILSLSIRLFSNMVAGHSLLHILFDMSLNVRGVIEHTLEILIFISVIALFIIYVIVIFEFVVAFLQAYVFCVMFSIYLNDLKLTH